MKKLTQNEFQDRMKAIVRARKIFIPHITKNISIAFELYQELIAEQDRDIFISTMMGGNRPRSFLDNEDLYKRPDCPKCGEPLYLRQIECGKSIKSNGNIHGWATIWSHLEDYGGDCIYEEYSKKTVQDWANELAIKKKNKLKK